MAEAWLEAADWSEMARLRGCGLKSTYATRARAKRVAKRVSRVSGYPLYVYCCPHCGNWHITKRPRDHDG